MTCYSPMKAYTPLSNLDGGKLVFDKAKALNPDHAVSLPCGQCIGCRVARQQEWATRCYHESQMHPASSFITLTYNDDHLPQDYSVHVRTFQLFMKRLRKEIPTKIRFFGCGEYGEENLRPHYHANIFGYDFRSDRVIHEQTKDGIVYTSPTLDKAWPHGFNTVCDLTPKLANYCAGYVLKKIGGDPAASHYRRLHPKGYVVDVQPEFATQSRRPGIGDSWFQKYRNDCFPSDFIVVDGVERPVPTYYFRKLQKGELFTPDQTPEQIQQKRLRNSRAAASLKQRQHQTPERLEVRKTVKTERLKQLKRKL